MIKWKLFKESESIAEAVGVKIPAGDKTTLEEALASYAKSEKLVHPDQVADSSEKILTILKGRTPISKLVVADANRLFVAVRKIRSEVIAYRVRSTLASAVRFAATGEVPDYKPAANVTPDGEDIKKLRFSTAKLEAVKHLIPLFKHTGRFGWTRGEVQRLTYTLGDDEVGYVEAPKRAMTQKEAAATVASITQMLDEASLPWTFTWNPNDSVFILIRNSQLEKLFPKKFKGKP